VGERVEWLYVFDPRGRQIARFRGTADAVDLSDELKERRGGSYGQPRLKHHQIVHNHPPTAAVPSFPPSPSDLAMAVACDLASLVVVSGRTRYLVARPGTAWPMDETLLVDLVEAAYRELREALGDLGRSEQRRVGQQRLILERLARDGWIDYVQTERLSDV
jgi:hypothetical protein